VVHAIGHYLVAPLSISFARAGDVREARGRCTPNVESGHVLPERFIVISILYYFFFFYLILILRVSYSCVCQWRSVLLFFSRVSLVLVRHFSSGTSRVK
jgi:hypothetical protein